MKVLVLIRQSCLGRCVIQRKEGLGIKKKIVDWNCASMMRHIMSIFVKLGSLWVAWVKENLFRRSF